MDSRTPQNPIIMRFALALPAVAVLLAPTISYAGPPYMTDDPEPVEFLHWEVYLAAQHFSARDGSSGSAPLVDLNYGAWPGLQLHVMGQLTYARPSFGPTSHGVGDTELGAKIRFVNEGEWWPMMSVYPLLDFPTGDASRRLGTGRVHAFVPLWLQKSLGPWTTFGGGGFWANPGAGNRDYWYLGWEVQRRISPLATIGTEAFYTTPDQVGGDANLRFNVGFILDLTEQHHLLLSAGRSIAGNSLFQSYVAYQLTL
jgi:hypothetical protein